MPLYDMEWSSYSTESKYNKPIYKQMSPFKNLLTCTLINIKSLIQRRKHAISFNCYHAN